MYVLDFPIEPIEDRYSIQWTKWFEDAFARHQMRNIQFKPRGAPLEPNDSKSFLNPDVTFGWKFRQLLMAHKWIGKNKNTLVCFFHDAWFPGMESMKYIAEMNGVKLKICGFWHAGSYLSNDLLGIKGFHSWVRGSEQTWFNLCDVVCVGSQYHKERILASLGQKDTDADKVIVTGYPIDVPDYNGKFERENIVVWPHRIAEDKHPEIFDYLAKDFAGDWQFIRSKDVCKTKDEYYQLLAKSKIAISTATMETFGIAIVEAVRLGCVPLVPDSLSYPETIPHPYYRYKNYKELQQKLSELMISLQKTQKKHHMTIALGHAGDCMTIALGHAGDYGQKSITDKICRIIRKLGEDE